MHVLTRGGRAHTVTDLVAADADPWVWAKTQDPGFSSSPLLITSGGSIPLLCLQGVPDLHGEPQDEAGLPRKFET